MNNNGDNSASSSRPRPTLSGIPLNVKPAKPQATADCKSDFPNEICIPNVCDRRNLTMSDLEKKCEIGEGGFGFVNKTLYKPANTMIAVKWIRATMEIGERTKALKDLEIIKSAHSPFIVSFYGAVFHEGFYLICMELMESSLEEFYKISHRHLKNSIPEDILGKIVVSILSALSYLKNELKVIHRDVKPSNILIDRPSAIKMCDFGISGKLENSLARTRAVGCHPYMAPERVGYFSPDGYDVRSDIWSFGIMMIEISTGLFPYPKFSSSFDQMDCVVTKPAPTLKTCSSLSNLTFSDSYHDFISQCLQKDLKARPKYARLMDMPFFTQAKSAQVDVGSFFSLVLDVVPASMTTRDFIKEHCNETLYIQLPTTAENAVERS